jgi:hypothetical protein
MRPRFSLGDTMAVVVLTGLSLTVLYGNGGGLRAFGVIASTMLIVGMLFTSILGAVLRRVPDRALWLGFAVFGWVFFVVALAQHTTPALGDRR